MNWKDKKYMMQTFDKEGIDYAFRAYSDFSNIDSEEFHELRREYLRAETLVEMATVVEKLEKFFDEDLKEYFLREYFSRT